MFRMELVKRSQVKLWCRSCAERRRNVRVTKSFYTKCGGIVLSRVCRVKIDNVSNSNGRELYRMDWN
jgi:hypothetical protein